MHKLTIHGCWWVRDEDLDLSVLRTGETFARLSHLHRNWDTWFAPTGRPEHSISDRPKLVRERFLQSFPTESGIGREDALGYSLMALSQPENEILPRRSTLRIRCCSPTAHSGYNTIALALPEPENALDIYEHGLLCRSVAALVKIWDPDWMVVWDLRTSVPWRWPPKPALGWINYLANRTGVLPKRLPHGWNWFEERAEERIFIHAGGPPDSSNIGHINAFKSMGDSIRWADLPH